LPSYVIPWPPSTNTLYRAFRGRNILSAKARKWAIDAGAALLEQKARPIKGPVEVEIELACPTKRKFDPDNRVKAVLDLLVKCYIIEDDDHSILRRFSVSLGEGFVGARVTVKPTG